EMPHIHIDCPCGAAHNIKAAGWSQALAGVATARRPSCWMRIRPVWPELVELAGAAPCAGSGAARPGGLHHSVALPGLAVTGSVGRGAVWRWLAWVACELSGHAHMRCVVISGAGGEGWRGREPGASSASH